MAPEGLSPQRGRFSLVFPSFAPRSPWMRAASDSPRRWKGFTYCRASERSVVAVLLPGLVEALHKLLEESVRLVENGKPQDVDSVVQQAVQALEGKLLKQPKTESRVRKENRHQKVQNQTTLLKGRWCHAAKSTGTHHLQAGPEILPPACKEILGADHDGAQQAGNEDVNQVQHSIFSPKQTPNPPKQVLESSFLSRDFCQPHLSCASRLGRKDFPTSVRAGRHWVCFRQSRQPARNAAWLVLS